MKKNAKYTDPKILLNKVVINYNLNLLDEEQLHLRGRITEKEEQDDFILTLSIPNAKIKEEVRVNMIVPEYEDLAYELLLTQVLTKTFNRTL